MDAFEHKKKIKRGRARHKRFYGTDRCLMRPVSAIAGSAPMKGGLGPVAKPDLVAWGASCIPLGWISEVGFSGAMIAVW